MRSAVIEIPDNGGRRWGLDRRLFSYDAVIPDNRNQSDRRSGADRRNCNERRTCTDRRSNSPVVLTGFVERRAQLDRRSGSERRNPAFA